jgi:serine/threonine protein kinase
MTRFEFDTTPHGSGGFAEIRKGRDIILERDVAVKVFRTPNDKFSVEEQERFKREARTLAKLSHPNIPSIYDVSFDEELLIISEFINGINLAEYLEEHGPCSITQAKLWFRQIASALNHAHMNGVIHRDIKPENIIIQPDLENAYLIDFGIALRVEEGERLTADGYVIGTPGYMSQEQESGEELDNRTDIFSLGVTLYEALAGNRPSLGSYTPLSIKTENIPEQIDSLIQDCLLPRNERVSSAIQFSERITGALKMQKPLSEILSRGRIYELSLVLRDEDFSADTFAALPSGQRTLVLVKIESIINSDDENLVYPGAELLEIMLEKGIRLGKKDYCRIVSPAIVWAFEKDYPTSGGKTSKGRRSLQDKLKDVCLKGNRDAHDVLKSELEKFISAVDLTKKENWFLHAFRDVLSNLLANSCFSNDASKFEKFLTAINTEQLSRE